FGYVPVLRMSSVRAMSQRLSPGRTTTRASCVDCPEDRGDDGGAASPLTDWWAFADVERGAGADVIEVVGEGRDDGVGPDRRAVVGTGAGIVVRGVVGGVRVRGATPGTVDGVTVSDRNPRTTG